MAPERSLAVLFVALAGAILVPHFLLSAPPTWAGDEFHSAVSSGVLMALQQVEGSSYQQVSTTLGDDVNVSSSTFLQNEPSVSLNPSNARNLVVGANDFSLGFPWLADYRSIDGGFTWKSGTIPRSGVLAFVQFASDPAVSFSQNGTLFYSGVAFNVNAHGDPVDSTIFVSKSTDGGTSFVQTAVVAMSLPNKEFPLNDKPYLTVDQTIGPSEGRIYISWTRFTSLSTSDIVVAYSSNGGASFSSPVQVSTGLLNQGSIPVVGPQGELYVVWNDLSNLRIMEAKSTNGGISFSSPVQVSSYVPLPIHLTNSSFRVNNNPTAAVDDTVGNVYVSWADYRNGYSNILFSRSTDGGSTWSRPTKVNDDATNHDHFFPWMSVSHGILSIDFYDRRLDPQNRLIDVFYTESADGGTSFSPNIRVTDQSSNPGNLTFIGDYIGIACNQTLAHPVWTDLRNVSPTYPQNEDIFTETRPVNQPPVISPIGTRTVYPGVKLQFSVQATDPDVGETLRLAAVGIPSGSAFASIPSTTGTVTGNFSWSPSPAQAPNIYSIEFKASDGSLTSTTNASITVSANSPPSLVVPGPQIVTAGSSLTFTVSATDYDSPPDYVTISCDNCIKLGATFNSSTNIFTWTPTLAQGPGDYSVNFTATDHLLPQLSETKPVAVHVDRLNQPPSLRAIPDWTINDETLLTFKVNATDPDIPSETLTFSLAVNAPPGATIGPDGVFSWTPAEVQAPGTYKFTVTVSDGTLSDSKTVTVIVIEPQQPPVLTIPGTQTVQVGDLIIFNVNATNPDADDLVTLTAYGLPQGASFDPDLGVFDWTPDDGQSGVYTITFRGTAVDPNGLSTTKTITITVQQASSSGQTAGQGGAGIDLWLAVTSLALLGVVLSALAIRLRRRNKASE